MIKVYSISLGCPKNRVDTERLLGALGEKVRPVKRMRSADLVLINTCGFIDPAVRESVGVILECAEELGGLDETNRPLLAVAGCLVGRYGEKSLAPDLAEVDLWLPTAAMPEWPEMLRAALDRRFERLDSPGAAEEPGASGTSSVSGASAVADGSDMPVGSSSIENENSVSSGKKAVLQKAVPGTGAALKAPAKRQTGRNAKKIKAEYQPEGRLLSTGPSYAWLKISEGCGQSCSFCTIPQIRGKVRSLDIGFLEAEARYILSRGVPELVLVAQDLTSWGRDLKDGSNLVSLLERLLPLPGLERLRLMYLYPAGMTDELLSFLQQAGRPFIPYFDIPLQHADPDILTRMGRPFSQSPLKVVERIRKYLPDAALRTSLITGFPGESEAAFAALYKFVEEVRFQNLGVFAYEAEDGTPAAAMPGQLPVELRQERRDRIMELQAGISEDILQGYLGQELEVLVDEASPEWPGLFTGRAWFQAPEVDGVVYVSGEDIRPGNIVRARINETFAYDLNGLVE